MPIAFFNISSSNSASLSFLSKSLMIFCSGVCFKVPVSGKLPVPNFSYSLRHLYNIVTRILSSLASSVMFDVSLLNSTAFILNAVS